MKKIVYEWVIETKDEHGDIQDVNHSETFPGFPQEGTDVGVVRDVVDETGVIDRSWAYIENGVLQSHFQVHDYDEKNDCMVPVNIAAVPMRFHRELKAA